MSLWVYITCWPQRRLVLWNRGRALVRGGMAWWQERPPRNHTHVLPLTGYNALGQFVSLSQPTFLVIKWRSLKCFPASRVCFFGFHWEVNTRKWSWTVSMGDLSEISGTTCWNKWTKVLKTLFSKPYTKVIFKYFEGMVKAGQPASKEITCMEHTVLSRSYSRLCGLFQP